MSNVGKEVRTEKEYVTVPELDFFEQKHPSIWINDMEFKPGTHLVEPEVAKEIAERCRIFNKSQLRLMSHRPDRQAVVDSGH